MSIENKESFHARLQPYLSPSDILDVKLAYTLAKFGHRSQSRKEMVDGKPMRYFEHVRRVSLILIDEMSIINKDMIIAALCHDSIEDSHDIQAELLEHCFGTNVVSIVKILSKVPKDGYHERLAACKNWEAIAIKACDRLDNLRSLMVPGTSREFQKRQVEETKKYYFPLFDNLLEICPKHYIKNIIPIRDEIRRLVERYSVIIELDDIKEVVDIAKNVKQSNIKELKKCPYCDGGYRQWKNEEDYKLCLVCKGTNKVER